MTEYQSRLRALLADAQGEMTLRELARKAGNEAYRSRFSWWLNRQLERPLRADSYKILARIDTKNRTPQQIKNYLLTGSDAGYGDVFFLAGLILRSA